MMSHPTDADINYTLVTVGNSDFLNQLLYVLSCYLQGSDCHLMPGTGNQGVLVPSHALATDLLSVLELVAEFHHASMYSSVEWEC